MTNFLYKGDTLWPTSEESIKLSKTIPNGTWVLLSSLEGLFLKPIEPLMIEGKIYGDASVNADRIINTFASRPNSTGVILEGEKGSGKTYLARLVSQKMREENIPTIIINSPLFGDSLNIFIQSINQPCVIFFDEFEKIYDTDSQNKLLTLFDGVFPSKKLFIVALNDTYRLVDFFKNRPGRFFYRLKYKGLDENFIKEYLEDNLENKENISGFISYISAFDSFNFDMLKALVEEMNRYQETVGQSAKLVNAQPVMVQQVLEVKTLIHNKERIDLIPDIEIDVNDRAPFNIFQAFSIYYSQDTPKRQKSKYDREGKRIIVLPTHFKQFQDGEYLFEGPEYSAVLVKPSVKPSPYERLYQL